MPRFIRIVRAGNGMELKLDEVLAEMRGFVEFSNYRIQFRDREREVDVLLNDALRYAGLRVIYGPYGAGKSTFLRQVSKALKAVNGVYVVYMNFEGNALSSVLTGALPSGDDVLARVRLELGNVDTFKAGFAVAEALKLAITYALRRYRAEKADRLLLIFDNLDKYLREAVGDKGYVALSGLLEFFAEAHEHPSEEVWGPFANKLVNTIFAVSDQAALDLAVRLGSKGLATSLLLWNLPKKAFTEVINEVAGLTSTRNVDADLLWNLIGGNVRELGNLVFNYGWDLGKWLEGFIMVNIPKNALRRGKGIPIKALLRRNIVIKVRVPNGKQLSELPKEPWINDEYAYQLPAYYWVLEAMAKEGKINVSPEYVLKIIKH